MVCSQDVMAHIITKRILVIHILKNPLKKGFRTGGKFLWLPSLFYFIFSEGSGMRDF